jgi:hypothetical protein
MMNGTFFETEKIIINAINDKYNKVIALTGRWGIGKTFLWKAINAKYYSGCEDNKKPIYASLFGAKNISEFKIRLLRSSLGIDGNGIVEKFTNLIGGLFKSVVSSTANYDAENGMLLFLPNLMESRLIVIDDVERKHGSFDLDELLGFLDEYSENYHVQFLMILNTDKLKDAGIWKEMHEKVIDVEIKFNPTSTECFDAAFSKTNYPCLVETKKSIEIMNLKNIRVMERILRTIKLIKQHQLDSDAIYENWIPSVALITASYYQALEDNVPLEYILSCSRHENFFDQEKENVNEREAKWDHLLEKMGVYYSDDFEKLICDYLISGNFDREKLDNLFNGYRSNIKLQQLESEVSNFKQDFYWNSKVSKQCLLNTANNFSSKISELNPVMVSSIVKIVKELGNNELAEKLLDLWLASLDSRDEYKNMIEIPYFGPRVEVNQKILSKLNSIVENNSNTMTLMQAFDDIHTFEKRSQKAYDVFKKSTCNDYKGVLFEISGSQLRDFILFHINFIQRPESPENEGSAIAIKNFVSACKEIIQNQENDRIAFIIRSNFQRYNLMDMIK